MGKFGCFDFKAGYYLYVGSDQRSLSARLERYTRKDKLLCKHIDYLSAEADMIGAITIAGTRERECESKHDGAQKREALLDCAILNKMLEIGRPVSYAAC
ncbi:DUF123 domain-containing protein [Planctomycetota bacterium]